MIKSRNPFFKVLAKNRRLTEKYRPIRENDSFIPGNPIKLNRNDVRIFRISVPTGSFQLTVTPSFGDVDVSVFQGFGVNAPRCALSVNNGSQPETVTVHVAGHNFVTLLHATLIAQRKFF